MRHPLTEVFAEDTAAESSTQKEKVGVKKYVRGNNRGGDGGNCCLRGDYSVEMESRDI